MSLLMSISKWGCIFYLRKDVDTCTVAGLRRWNAYNMFYKGSYYLLADTCLDHSKEEASHTQRHRFLLDMTTKAFVGIVLPTDHVQCLLAL